MAILTRKKRTKGFSLIELLIVMALLTIVIAMSTETFSLILRQSREQTHIVGTQIESIIGLEMLRIDIERAGYGLPWSFQNAIAYNEATDAIASPYNDSSSGIPRAIVSGDNVAAMLNNSDYIAIKSTSVGRSNASQEWTYIIGGQTPKQWGTNDIATGERVVVIKTNVDERVVKRMVMNGSTFFTAYSSSSFPTTFSPTSTSERFVIYGVDSDTDLRMPFNRVDYYVKRPTSDMPTTCAPGTGILYRATVNQNGGSLNEMPVLDCIADLQAVYRLDTDGDGVVDTNIADLTSPTLYTAEQIRQQLKEVRVYVLLHEGELDSAYKYPSSSVTVGEYGLGSTFNLSTNIGANWDHYRWKVNTLVVRPRNL